MTESELTPLPWTLLSVPMTLMLVLHSVNSIPTHYWTVHIFFPSIVNRFKAFFEHYSKTFKGIIAMLLRNFGIE